MAKTLSEVMKKLPRERRARIEAETARDAAKIMSLRDVRKAFHRSQEELAKAPDMEQESISRIERRADLSLFSLRRYLAAMGGDLKLIAEFPDRPPISHRDARIAERTGDGPAGKAQARLSLSKHELACARHKLCAGTSKSTSLDVHASAQGDQCFRRSVCLSAAAGNRRQARYKPGTRTLQFSAARGEYGGLVSVRCGRL
jgi:transcriptional regulator with XRE-family HTH domain